VALQRRLEAGPEGRWACGKQLDKFRGYFFEFASSWTKVTQVYKLKGRQCILLFFFSVGQMWISNKKFLILNIFSVATLWGIWKPNSMYLQNLGWKDVKSLLLKIVVITQ
jgi:hypothetical protein